MDNSFTNICLEVFSLLIVPEEKNNKLIFVYFSLSLGCEDMNLQDNEELKFILKIVNLVFAVLFTVEMFLKWIAFGLWRYFSSVWTCLDFVIVCVSWLEY